MLSQCCASFYLSLKSFSKQNVKPAAVELYILSIVCLCLPSAVSVVSSSEAEVRKQFGSTQICFFFMCYTPVTLNGLLRWKSPSSNLETDHFINNLSPELTSLDPSMGTYTTGNSALELGNMHPDGPDGNTCCCFWELSLSAFIVVVARYSSCACSVAHHCMTVWQLRIWIGESKTTLFLAMIPEADEDINIMGCNNLIFDLIF